MGMGLRPYLALGCASCEERSQTVKLSHCPTLKYGAIVF